MDANSRTSLSIRNVVVALFYFVAAMALQFVSRRVFIDNMGAEVLGLNTTATNLLQFLNLAELGVGAAIGYALYKPIEAGDRSNISEIIALQGFIYRRVGWAVIAGAVVLCCFFPLIFARMDLPLWYAYGTFGALLLSSLLSYFFNYRQVIMVAEQREYRFKHAYYSVLLVKTSAQIVAVATADNPYVWWLVIQCAGVIVGSIVLRLATRHFYPYLFGVKYDQQALRTKYPDVAANTRRLFFHRISEYVLTQTSPLIIYAFATLTVVTYYDNYMIVVGGVLILLQTTLNNLNPGVGNLVATGNSDNTRRVFNELFSLCFFIAAFFSILLWFLLQPLVAIWLGSQYVMPRVVLALILAIFFINGFRRSIETFKDAYGLFYDVWAAGTEAVLNLGLSIAGGVIWGLPGILAGVLISQVLIVLGWKSYFVCRRGLRTSPWFFWGAFFRHIPAAIVAFVALWLVLPAIGINPTASTGAFIAYAAVAALIVAAVLVVMMLMLTPGMRLLCNRLKDLLP